MQKPQYDLCCEVLRRMQSHRVLHLLFERGDDAVLREILGAFPKAWRKTIFKMLDESGQSVLCSQLKGTGPR